MAIKMEILDNQKENQQEEKANEEDLEPKVELLKLSASSMKTFDQCPRKYYYNYIERVPRKQWDHFDLGNLCHKVLEIFHEIYMEEGTRRKKSLSKLMGHSFAEGRKEFAHVSNDLVAEAKSLVTDYLEVISQTGMPLVKGVETSFNFNLREDILLRGFLDRVDITKEGKFHIVDYKTTKNEKYLEPFQLLIYGLWLRDEYPEVEEFEASYVLLRHKAKLKSYKFNRHDIEQAEKKVITFADKIRASDAADNWVPVPTPLCNWCDFQSICPTQGW